MNFERDSFDADYVQRLTAGDTATQRHFTDYFTELIYTKLRWRLRSREDIDDVRQETFLRVLLTLRKNGLEHPERLGAFVNSVCNNVMMELFRSHGRVTAMPEEGFEPPAPGDNIEAVFVSDQRKAQVRKIIQALPQKDRAILEAVFYEERDKDEVCRDFQVERGYLRVLVHRATSRLKEGVRKATTTLHSFFFLMS